MKYIFTITLIIFSLNLNCQSIIELEKKNGFKDFKLGDSYSKWSSQLKAINNSPTNRSYHYEGYCCKDVFGYNVEHIFLDFNEDNVLVDLTAYIKPYRDNRKSNDMITFTNMPSSYIGFLDNFISLFGDYKKMALTADEDTQLNGKMYSTWWESNSIVLVVDYYFYLYYDYSTVRVFNKNEWYKRKKSSF